MHRPGSSSSISDVHGQASMHDDQLRMCQHTESEKRGLFGMAVCMEEQHEKKKKR